MKEKYKLSNFISGSGNVDEHPVFTITKFKYKGTTFYYDVMFEITYANSYYGTVGFVPVFYIKGNFDNKYITNSFENLNIRHFKIEDFDGIKSLIRRKKTYINKKKNSSLFKEMTKNIEEFYLNEIE